MPRKRNSEINNVNKEEFITEEVVTEENEVIDQYEEKTTKGIVTGCDALYVRSEPNKKSNPNCIIKVSEEVAIDTDKSTYEWYKVCTEKGIEGFCMKEFISILE